MNFSSQSTDFLINLEKKLEERLRRETFSDFTASDILQKAIVHLCLGDGAKRARPWLTYQFGQSVGASDESLLDMGMTAELIHAASLLHDDVMDEGTLRRGRTTVNIKWNNVVSVLSGDLLLSTALMFLKPYPAKITFEAIEVIFTMTQAVAQEIESRNQVDLPLEDWKKIAKGKTGLLFGWCGQSSAHLMKDKEAVESFKRCGAHLGLAFQMADDLKDILASDSGKDRFSDIRMGNPSFVLLTAIQLSLSLANRLKKSWQKEKLSIEEVEALGFEVMETKATSITCQNIQEEIEKALHSLGSYKERPGGKEIVLWAESLWQNFKEKVKGY